LDTDLLGNCRAHKLYLGAKRPWGKKGSSEAKAGRGAVGGQTRIKWPIWQRDFARGSWNVKLSMCAEGREKLDAASRRRVFWDGAWLELSKGQGTPTSHPGWFGEDPCPVLSYQMITVRHQDKRMD
jgi:hypothetical protein